MALAAASKAYGAAEVAAMCAPVATLMHHMVAHIARCHGKVGEVHWGLRRLGNEVLFHQDVVAAYTVCNFATFVAESLQHKCFDKKG
jgi:hypothetical protein